jgi:hypothetical protein
MFPGPFIVLTPLRGSSSLRFAPLRSPPLRCTTSDKLAPHRHGERRSETDVEPGGLSVTEPVRIFPLVTIVQSPDECLCNYGASPGTISCPHALRLHSSLTLLIALLVTSLSNSAPRHHPGPVATGPRPSWFVYTPLCSVALTTACAALRMTRFCHIPDNFACGQDYLLRMTFCHIPNGVALGQYYLLMETHELTGITVQIICIHLIKQQIAGCIVSNTVCTWWINSQVCILTLISKSFYQLQGMLQMYVFVHRGVYE